MKGFKDKGGKFHPTENKNGLRKSRDRSMQTQGILIRKSRDSTKKTLLQNRASVGIRAYANIMYKGRPATIEISTHHPFGKYIVEIYQDGYGEMLPERFDKFSQVKKFVEEKFNVRLDLDKKNSNDYQTWEQNIKQTDHELPFDRIFWSLDESVRDEIHVGESIEQFLKRKGFA